MRCWCEDYLLWSLCLNVLLFLVSKQYIDPSSKWTGTKSTYDTTDADRPCHFQNNVGDEGLSRALAEL